MTRPLAILALALAGMLTATGAAGASHQGSGGGPRDFAVGTFTTGDMQGSFAAHGGPSPFEPVSGHFLAKGEVVDTGPPDKGPTAFRFAGPVTCLNVQGNRAGLIYPIEKADPETFEGQAVLIFLEDNGKPSGGDSPDRVGFVGPAPISALPACTPGPTPFDADKGNVTIHEGS